MIREKYYLIPSQYSSTVCVPIFQKKINIKNEINSIIKKQFGNIPVVYDFEFTRFYKNLRFSMLTIIIAHKTQTVKGKRNFPVDYFYLKCIANMAPVPVMVVFKYPDEELYELAIVGNKKIFKISDKLSKPPSYDFIMDFYKTTINSFRSIEIVNLVILADKSYKLENIENFIVDYVDYSDVEKHFYSSLNILKGQSRVYISPETSFLVISIFENLYKKVIAFLLIFVLLSFIVNNLNNYKLAIEKNIAEIRNVKNKIGLEERIKILKEATDNLKTWVNAVKVSEKNTDYLKTIYSVLYQNIIEIKSITINTKDKTIKITGVTDNYEKVIDFLKFLAKLENVKSVSYPELKKYEKKQDFVTVVELYE